MFVGGAWSTLIQLVTLGMLLSMTGDKKLGLNAYDAGNKEDLATLGKLYESGDVRPVIDRRYPLEKVPEGLQYLAEGTHLGKLVITMEESVQS